MTHLSYAVSGETVPLASSSSQTLVRAAIATGLARGDFWMDFPDIFVLLMCFRGLETR